MYLEECEKPNVQQKDFLLAHFNSLYYNGAVGP